MGWVRSCSDIDFTVVKWYDDGGNLRTLLVDSQHPQTKEPLPCDEQVFVQNAANQIEVARAGRESENKLQLRWKNGVHADGSPEERATSAMVYDGQGRRQSLTFYRRDKESYIQEDYHFDDRGRLARVTHTDGEGTKDQAWWRYDDANRLMEEYTRGEGTRTYAWSPGNRLWQLIEEKGADKSTTTQADMQTNWAPDGTLKQTRQKGVKDENRYTSTITYTHTHFEEPIETQVTHKRKTDNSDEPTTGIGTTQLGPNGEPMEYVDTHNQAKRNKQILSLPTREVVEVIEDGTSLADANRYYRVYLDDKGNIVGEFAKDPERKELAAEGNFRFELSLQPTTEAGPAQHMQMTAPADLTLEELAGGSQEWLDALLHANPGISATEELNGRQIIIPYGETRTTQTVHDKGIPGNQNQRIGSTVPTAPLPYMPYQKEVGGFKNGCR